MRSLDEIERISTLAVGDRWVGTCAHFNHERNGQVAIVTTDAPTRERARAAAIRWKHKADADVEARLAWGKPDPSFPEYRWQEHPDRRGYYQVVRVDATELTPFVETA